MPPIRRKKLPVPWIIGGCAGLILVGIFGSMLLSMIYHKLKGAVDRVEMRQAATAVPTGWRRFENSLETTPAGLKANFVPFSFTYPEKFVPTPIETNFIKVEERLTDEGGAFTLENFSVGYITLPAGPESDAVYTGLLNDLSRAQAAGIPNYREIVQFPEEVAGQRGRALLFEGEVKNSPKGDVRVFGKVIVARKARAERGVAIFMLATSLDPEVKEVRDLGEKGELASILDSFEFGN